MSDRAQFYIPSSAARAINLRSRTRYPGTPEDGQRYGIESASVRGHAAMASIICRLAVIPYLIADRERAAAGARDPGTREACLAAIGSARAAAAEAEGGTLGRESLAGSIDLAAVGTRAPAPPTARPTESRPPLPSVTEVDGAPLPLARTTLWPDGEGGWEVMDVVTALNTRTGLSAQRAIVLGDHRAERRAFVPYGWTGDVVTLRLTPSHSRYSDDRTLAMPFAAVHAVN